MTDLLNWLTHEALPTWWEVGGDRVRGGFYEAILQDGSVTPTFRRARVAGRQVFVYALAHKAGLAGPWKEAAAHGLDFITTRFIRPDGLMRRLLKSDGSPADDTVMLYDQAFCLFALAAAAEIGLDPHAQAARAHKLRAELERDWRLPFGGFTEREDYPYQANAHMHLLEASLAWFELTHDAAWGSLADEVANLALSKFIDTERGFLREFFSIDWQPADGEKGRLVEPGHLFEWAWLLIRWAQLRAHDGAIKIARRLFEIARGYGVDEARGVTINAITPEFDVADAQARLWPQTERIKAAAILRQISETETERAHFEIEAHAAARGLSLYFKTTVKGLWWDKLNPDGTFIAEPAPASSLYHIACALLDAKTRGCDL